MTEEELSKTRHPKIFFGEIAAYPAEWVRQGLDRLAALAGGEEYLELRRFFNEFLPQAQVKAEGGGGALRVAPPGSVTDI